MTDKDPIIIPDNCGAIALRNPVAAFVTRGLLNDTARLYALTNPNVRPIRHKEFDSIMLMVDTQANEVLLAAVATEADESDDTEWAVVFNQKRAGFVIMRSIPEPSDEEQERAAELVHTALVSAKIVAELHEAVEGTPVNYADGRDAAVKDIVKDMGIGED